MNNIAELVNTNDKKYMFDFIVNVKNGLVDVDVELPVIFKFDTQKEVLNITGLTISWFQSADIFTKYIKEVVTHSQKDFLNEKISVILKYSPSVGFKFSVNIKEEIAESKYREIIAEAILDKLLEYELELLITKQFKEYF
jgi:hypothetical protein